MRLYDNNKWKCTLELDIERNIIGEKIKIEIDDDEKESVLEHLFTFQWGLRKTFLKK